MKKSLVQYVLSEVLKERYVNARKIARRLRRKGIEISTRVVGRILKLLVERGILEIYTDRVGRFKIYRLRNLFSS